MANPNSAAQRSFAAEPYDSVAAVLASKQITAALVGQRIHIKGGLAYDVLPDSAAAWDQETEGGAKLSALPRTDGYEAASFGYIGPDAVKTTATLQRAINRLSWTNYVKLYLPVGVIPYTTLRTYYHATDNPDYNPERNGKIELVGVGTDFEYTSSLNNAGTILDGQNTSGDDLILSPASLDVAPFSAREGILRNLTIRSKTSGHALVARGMIAFDADNVKILQSNAAGNGADISSAWFGDLSKFWVQNIAAGTHTGDALKLSTAIPAGLFTVYGANFNGFRDGVVFNGGHWQQVAFRDGQVTAQRYPFTIRSGLVDLLNWDGLYFEGTCASFLKSEAEASGAGRIRQLKAAGCWFLCANLSGPAIDSPAFMGLDIQGGSAVNCYTPFVNVAGDAAGTGYYGAPSSVRNMIFDYTVNPTALVTLFQGVVPELSEVNWPRVNPNVRLYDPARAPVRVQAKIGSLDGYVSAHAVFDSKVMDYGPVAGTINLSSDGLPTWCIATCAGATDLILPKVGTLLPHGLRVTITSAPISAASLTVKKDADDGGATIAALTAGQQRSFVYFSGEGWK